MVRSYVLIEADELKVSKIVKELLELPGVKSAEVVMGPRRYSIIAVVEATDYKAIAKLVLGPVLAMNGVERVIDYPVLIDPATGAVSPADEPNLAVNELVRVGERRLYRLYPGSAAEYRRGGIRWAVELLEHSNTGSVRVVIHEVLAGNSTYKPGEEVTVSGEFLWSANFPD